MTICGNRSWIRAEPTVLPIFIAGRPAYHIVAERELTDALAKLDRHHERPGLGERHNPRPPCLPDPAVPLASGRVPQIATIPTSPRAVETNGAIVRRSAP